MAAAIEKSQATKKLSGERRSTLSSLSRSPRGSKEDALRKQSDTSFDSMYGHTASNPIHTPAEEFMMDNPILNPGSPGPIAPGSPHFSEGRRTSLSLSATSRVDMPKFLDRRRTRHEEKEEKEIASDEEDAKQRTRSEGGALTRDSMNDYYRERDTQSDFADVEHVVSENFDSVVVRNDVEMSYRGHHRPDAQYKKLYIHVRHFTKVFNRFPLKLQALIWFEDGSCFGPIVLGNHIRGEPLNKPLFKYHLVGEAPLDFPFASPIAFLQLRKVVGKITSTVGLETDIFIQDAYIKPSADHAPDVDILAYFRFTGFLVSKANILLINILTHVRNLTTDAVRNNARNKKKYIQDKLEPGLEWASVEAAEVLWYKTRTIVDTFGKKKGTFDFVADVIFTRSKPLYANMVLSLRMDVKRYQGTPGFARLPPNDWTFSALKFTEFIDGRLQPLPFAHKVAAQSKAPWRMSMIDFTPFLQSELSSTSEREMEEVKWIVTNFDKDQEFGRLFVESLFCTHLHVVKRDQTGICEALKSNTFRAVDPKTSSEECKGPMCYDYLHNKHPVVSCNPDWVGDLMADAKMSPATSRLFYLDYSKLVGIPRNEKVGFFSPARCLLKFDENLKMLFPVAISLYYPEQDKWKTHLPSDKSWRVAKIFCKCAAAQDHQIVSHALYTHLVIEPFAIALERRVPLDHILYRLLKTHFRYTLDVNFKARTTLINQGGVFDQFIGTGGIHDGHLKYMVRIYNEWTIDKMCLPDELASRGFMKDPNADDCELPGYMYAKDAMDLFRALETYVTSIVNISYPTDQDYSKDEIARNYFMEVQSYGFPTAPTFVPTNKTELIRVLTSIIYTAAVQHAAVNFPQFSHYAFIANSPLCLTKAAPEPGVETDFREYLPRVSEAAKTIITAWGLSRFVPDDERFMFSHDHHFFNLSMFNDPAYRPACHELERSMAELEKKILQRPRSPYGTRYLWLLPSMLPTSIAS